MNTLPDTTLERLAEVVHRRLGLDFPRDRWRDLARGLEAACKDLGEPGVENCSRTLLSSSLDRRQLEILGLHLTVGETYFFREPQAYRIVTSEILPDLVSRRRNEGRFLRFWSAACSTGEEPYSLAILLRENLPDIDQWNVTILATDINPESLRRAEEGLYRQWSFRGEQERVKQKWFDPTPDGRFLVHPELRRMVTFLCHNLAEDPYPSLDNGTNAMDVIFCRNVLMYFSEPKRQVVISRLQQSLIEGGILIFGAAESALRPTAALEPVPFRDLIVFRKRTSFQKVQPPLPPPPQVKAHQRLAPPAPRTGETLQRLKEAFARGDYGLVCQRAAALTPGQPGYGDAVLMAARACANSGSLDAALHWVDAALSNARAIPEIHYLRAMILDELGRTSEALDALRTTLYLDPDFVPAYVAKGHIYRREGDRRNSERNFRNALVLLEPLGDDDPVPHAEEMRAGRMREAVLVAMGGG